MCREFQQPVPSPPVPNPPVPSPPVPSPPPPGPTPPRPPIPSPAPCPPYRHYIHKLYIGFTFIRINVKPHQFQA